MGAFAMRADPDGPMVGLFKPGGPYSRGFQLSSSPAVTATQMSVVLLVGFLAFREPLGAGRLIGLGLIALGIVLLQRAGA